LPGAIHDQELVFQEKRLRDQGTDATRSEQPGQRCDQVDNKNGQIAHRTAIWRTTGVHLAQEAFEREVVGPNISSATMCSIG
jgi:hypothetical protein